MNGTPANILRFFLKGKRMVWNDTQHDKSERTLQTGMSPSTSTVRERLRIAVLERNGSEEVGLNPRLSGRFQSQVPESPSDWRTQTAGREGPRVRQIQAWRHTEGCDGDSAPLNSAGSDRPTRVVRPLLKSLTLVGGHDVLSGQDQITRPLLEDRSSPQSRTF